MPPAFPPRLSARRRLLAVAAMAAGAWLLVRPATLPAAAAEAEATAGPVVRVRLKSVIQPVAAEFLAGAIDQAAERGAQAVVIELDTPGGLMTSMREMTTAILGSRVPVVVYVAPSGAQAASAGFFLLMAADVAAMAPGTNAGAASPVGGQGEDLPETMKAKVTQDAAAFVRTLAERRGRNVEAAEATVTEARSYTAEEALDKGLVDLIAPDLKDLLEKLDGRQVARDRGEPRTLATAEAPVEEVEMSLFQRILAVIAEPTVAYLLLSLGGLGLIVELYNPGSIFPGVVGAICILLAFFGLSVLPVNHVGVALILLGLLFFVAEIKVTSYGLLTVGGVTCLVLGGLMLIKSPEPALRVSLQAIVSLAVVALLLVGMLMFLVVRSHHRQVSTGAEGLLHERGEARSALAPRGKVFVHGELWNAVAAEPVVAGQTVEVTGIDRMTLTVRPVAAADRPRSGEEIA
jgi:membrane-bound serine protease (ClpP class)